MRKKQCQTHIQALRIRLANCISFCMIVTLFACKAHKFVSSNRCTKYASAASCSAMIAWDCHRNGSLALYTVSEISLTYSTLAKLFVKV
jgi:hypothetical protein